MSLQLAPLPYGRDKFIEMAKELGFQFEVKRSKARTTIPGELSWENLIEGMLINQINMVWQSDITYFYSGGKEFYIIFLLDIYSKRIIGYEASEHMKATANLKCLKKSFKTRGRKFFKNLIHHSDRGSQYTSIEYLGKLFNANIVPSMAFNAKENAYVERLNGIIKNEYLRYRDINSLGQLKRWLKQAVDHYNNVRIHESLPERLSPIKFENKYVNLESNRRPRMPIYSKGNYKEAKQEKLLNGIPEQEIQAFICPI
jgi:transposase InsO family protein